MRMVHNNFVTFTSRARFAHNNNNKIYYIIYRSYHHIMSYIDDTYRRNIMQLRRVTHPGIR